MRCVARRQNHIIPSRSSGVSARHLLTAKRECVSSLAPQVPAAGSSRIPETRATTAPTTPSVDFTSSILIENFLHPVTAEQEAASAASLPVCDQLARPTGGPSRNFASLGAQLSQALEGLRQGGFQAPTILLPACRAAATPRFLSSRYGRRRACSFCLGANSRVRKSRRHRGVSPLDTRRGVSSGRLGISSTRRLEHSEPRRHPHLPSDPTFAPLAACLEQVRGLRQLIKRTSEIWRDPRRPGHSQGSASPGRAHQAHLFRHHDLRLAMGRLVRRRRRRVWQRARGGRSALQAGRAGLLIRSHSRRALKKVADLSGRTLPRVDTSSNIASSRRSGCPKFCSEKHHNRG